MECSLPRSAFQAVETSSDTRGGDSIRCDLPTPPCGGKAPELPLSGDDSGNGPQVSTEGVDSERVKMDSSFPPESCHHIVKESQGQVGGNDVTSHSPKVTPTNHLRRLNEHMPTYFALNDDSCSVSGNFCDGFAINSVNLRAHYIESGSQAAMVTPIRSSRSFKGAEEGIVAHGTISMGNMREPRLNVSDDDSKNPILASSIRSARRMRNSTDDEDVQRSLQILGNSRCWTDRYDTGEEFVLDDNSQSEDDVLATQSPIRSLISFVKTPSSSQPHTFTRSPFSFDRKVALFGTPVRSVGYPVSNTATPNRYSQCIPEMGDASNLEDFGGARLSEMRKKPVNPMYLAMVSKETMVENKLGGCFDTLYKHFKNMCTIIRRSSMRNGRPYFRIVQVLVQRMTRKVFTMEHLRQMVWIAPNLVSIKWVVVSDMIRQKYPAEYRDCHEDVVNDLQIRIHRINGVICTKTIDFENTCLRFKSILCGWIARCRSESTLDKGGSGDFNVDMCLPIPMIELPDKCEGCNSNLATPIRDVSSISSRIHLDTPDSVSRGDSLRRASVLDAMDNVDICKSPCIKPISAASSGCRSSIISDSSGSSIKRVRTTEMSPMSLDLLNTPGMKIIRENAKKLASANNQIPCSKERSVKYWEDVLWFIKILVELSMDENRPPTMRLDWLSDFITKYGSRKVTPDQVGQWTTTLSEIAPDVLGKSISRFEDYATVLTIGSSPSFGVAIDYVNKQILKLSQV